MKNHTILKTDEDFKTKLTPQQYHVLREKGTEPAFTGQYYKTHDKGMYKCAACGNELFSSDTKFDSGTGWPSFYDIAHSEAVELKPDDSYGMNRVEVICKKCGSHLGHVFDDLPRLTSGKAGGPKDKGGKRYCINSCALDLEKKE